MRLSPDQLVDVLCLCMECIYDCLFWCTLLEHYEETILFCFLQCIWKLLLPTRLDLFLKLGFLTFTMYILSINEATVLAH